MITNNAEIKAPGTRGDKETGKHGIDSNRSGGFRQSRSETGSEPFTTCGDDWSWRDFIDSCGQANIGGILNRLTQKTRQQIEESEERTADLKQQVKKSEERTADLELQLAELQKISNEFFKNDSK